MSASQNAKGGPNSVPTACSRPKARTAATSPGGARVKHERQNEPQQCLRQHDDPEDEPRAGAHQFDNKGRETHRTRDQPVEGFGHLEGSGRLDGGHSFIEGSA